MRASRPLKGGREGLWIDEVRGVICTAKVLGCCLAASFTCFRGTPHPGGRTLQMRLEQQRRALAQLTGLGMP